MLAADPRGRAGVGDDAGQGGGEIAKSQSRVAGLAPADMSGPMGNKRHAVAAFKDIRLATAPDIIGHVTVAGKLRRAVVAGKNNQRVLQQAFFAQRGRDPGELGARERLAGQGREPVAVVHRAEAQAASPPASPGANAPSGTEASSAGRAAGGQPLGVVHRVVLVLVQHGDGLSLAIRYRDLVAHLDGSGVCRLGLPRGQPTQWAWCSSWRLNALSRTGAMILRSGAREVMETALLDKSIQQPTALSGNFEDGSRWSVTVEDYEMPVPPESRSRDLPRNIPVKLLSYTVEMFGPDSRAPDYRLHTLKLVNKSAQDLQLGVPQ